MTDDELFIMLEDALPFCGEINYFEAKRTRDITNSDIVVFGIPFDGASTNRAGSRFAPRSIREASKMIGISSIKYGLWDYSIFDKKKIIDYGDIVFLPGYTSQMTQQVEKKASDILQKGNKILSLGGDHLTTLPLLRAYAKEYGPLSLLQFDSHTDTFKLGPYLTHGNGFYYAVQEGLIIPEQSVQVGIRASIPKDNTFNIIEAEELFEKELGDTANKIKSIIKDHPTFITFDIDFLDPSQAPGTGTPVFGGLSVREARKILYLLKECNIVGADTVEVSPPLII